MMMFWHDFGHIYDSKLLNHASNDFTDNQFVLFNMVVKLVLEQIAED